MRFTGAQPVSIERRHLRRLLEKPYAVCEKTDGTRSFLIREDDEPYLINRALVKTPVKVRVPKQTYLDGEVIDGAFVVYDAMMIDSEDLCQMNLTDRMEHARRLIKKIPLVKGAFRLVAKNHVPLADISTLDPCKPGVDGLIFTPIDEPVRFGTHETLFKWKPLEHITVDFMYDREGFLCTQAGAVSKAKFQAPVGSIVECAFKNGQWALVKIRTDKNYANNKRTYERTLVNIREGIKFTELVQLVNGSGIQR